MSAAEEKALPPPHLRGHVPVLDGIRGLAILLVFARHVTDRLVAPEFSFDWWVVETMRTGWAGVDLFFVLSGYLITGILSDSRDSENYFKSFYARRALRIFPLYYACLLVLYVSVSIFKPGEGPPLGAPAWWYFAYLQTYLMFEPGPVSPIPAGFSITWSLAIEEQFYLVWPLLVFALNRRRMIVLCTVLLIAQPLARALLYHFVDEQWVIGAYSFTPVRLDGLVIGALLALLVRTPQGYEQLVRFRGALLALGGAGSLACLALSGGANPHAFPNGIYLYFFLALLFAGALVSALHAPVESRANRALTGSFLATWGKYSYAIYLLHLPVVYLVERRIFGWLWTDRALPLVLGSQLPILLGFVLLIGALSLGAGWLSWQLLEKRFLAFKSRFAVARRGAK